MKNKRLKIFGILLALGSMSLASCSNLSDILSAIGGNSSAEQPISYSEEGPSSDAPSVSESESHEIILNDEDEKLRQEIYKKAVEAGYQGTYEEWLDTIKGADGSTILFGSNEPSAEQGKNSDVYLNIVSWDVYLKANNTWTKLGNIIGQKGAQGDPGPQGPQGPQGQTGNDGKSLITGNGEPASSTGNSGDSYIDLRNFDFYTKNGNSWVKRGNLQGGNGESAYDIAVRLGFEGSEKEWLESLSAAPQVEEIKHMVKFDSTGGTPVNYQEIIHGEKAKKPGNPTRDGYTFVCWTLNGAEFNFNTKITSDITLVAKWDKIDSGDSDSDDKKCGGNLAFTSVILSLLSLSGIALLFIKKKD